MGGSGGSPNYQQNNSSFVGQAVKQQMSLDRRIEEKVLSPTTQDTFSTNFDNRVGSDTNTVEESGTFDMGYITFFPKNDVVNEQGTDQG